jgi:hypothetical protein
MAETIGSLTDKIIIWELKRFHMKEETLRKDTKPQHIKECHRKLAVLTLQRDDLANEMDELLEDNFSGRQLPKLYRQFKMYNDPKYKK